jgi:hypothetical protein
VLFAYDATNLTNLLYSSSQSGDRNVAGPAIKFTVPTATNGKLCTGTAHELNLYFARALMTFAKRRD